MGMNRKQVLLRQKERAERELNDRMAFLSGQGKDPAKADRDPLVRKARAAIKAVNVRLKSLADNEKRIEDAAKAKAEKAASGRREGKAEKAGKAEKPGKPKKGQEGAKEKKPKPEKKAAPPAAAE